MKVRAATRGSALARWQTDHVVGLLRAVDRSIEVEVVVVETFGDRRQDLAISAMGGKGVFAKEVQAAVLDGRADLAVHSAKDLPSLGPEGLLLAAVPERGDARDALVGATLEGLAEEATVATGSNRRRVQLAEHRPDLRFAELRGNMATRLEKAAGFDAIVVAAVALQRLGLDARISEILDPAMLTPQVGQGALAVECRSDDAAMGELLATIEHGPSRRRFEAERAFLVELGGDCDLPAGAYAVENPAPENPATEDPVTDRPTGDPAGAGMRLDAVLAAADGVTLRRHHAVGTDPIALGTEVARWLRRAGGHP